jgi:purine-binding chemotaxis protein CheW
VRLGLPRRQISEESHNVVLKYCFIGLLVDSIGDMAQCETTEIEPPPANIGNIEQRFIEGVVKLKDELLIVLSAAKVVEHFEN